ncbi:MAG: formate dehydrogenase accessory sulfurtransferase FdhD [Proteobacteria bacterium]|nr:formate dehydrogenase accessory sulfurtransferase FdhD [Pseudomonadota bacterium]
MRALDVEAARLPSGAVVREVERHRNGEVMRLRDALTEEVPIAFVYNQRPHAVMMATPADLEDFALGFSLSEGIVDSAAQCASIEPIEALAGIELHIAIPDDKAAQLEHRARELVGRTGCGLCGAQTLDAAVRHPSPLTAVIAVPEAGMQRALRDMAQNQAINAFTGAVHAAAWADLSGHIVMLREDVGRHNALDKLIGAMQRAQIDPGTGFLLVTSRASFEMVVKAATAGIGFMVAISAPTALAVALACDAGMTLIGLARADGYCVYAHPERVLCDRSTTQPSQ